MPNWNVIDDGLSRDAAERIVAARRSSGMWDGYELKIEPSQFHLNGTFQVEARRAAPAALPTHQQQLDLQRRYGRMSRAQRRRFLED